MSIDDIERRFGPEEFTLEPVLYVGLIEEMIPIGRRDGFSVEYIELMERLVTSLRDCDLPRTCHGPDCRLADQDRRSLFEIVAGWWPDAKTHEATASVLSILGALVPEPGVQEWMAATAEHETGAIAEALRSSATMHRTRYEI